LACRAHRTKITFQRQRSDFASTILISIAVSASAVEAAPNTQAAPFKT
jgi:hypothetical protein